MTSDILNHLLASLDPTGERAGLTTAFRSYGEFVYRVLSSYGVDASARDDCVQEVFIVALRRWDNYDPKSSLRSWLYGISRKVASDYRRSRQRRRVREEDGLRPQTRPGAEDAVASLEAARFVHDFCQSLDDDLRDIFVAIELESLSAQETAQSLSVNVNTVYTRLRKVRKLFDRTIDARKQQDPHFQDPAIPPHAGAKNS